jgi:hypothetical protein
MKKSCKCMSAALWCIVVGIVFFLSCNRNSGKDSVETAMAEFRPEAISSHMRFLADDLLEGRGTAARGQEIAAKYISSQFEQMGLAPAGDNGTYFQSVPLRSGKLDAAKSSLMLMRGGKQEKLIYRKDFYTWEDPGRSDSSVEAPVVFVGYGVTAPDQAYDDYADVDTKGKIAAMAFGAPGFPSAIKAHYSDWEAKQANAVAHGAIGMILISDPVREEVYSYSKSIRDLDLPRLRWLDKQNRPNNYFPELRGGAHLSLEETKKFFSGSGHTAEEVFAGIKSGKPQSFVLPFTAKIRNVTKLEDVRSPNVVAKLEGSDPSLKNQYIVYSSHSDHLGIGQPVNGDKIYNGAVDNSSGTALLIEIARVFTKMNPRPKRSLLFLSVTGEEAGLLGSDYYAHYPTVARDAMVANINIDSDLMWWPMEDIVAFGAEHSSLGKVVEKAAGHMKLSIGPDPMPEQVFFIRSDQYSFVKQGVPAIWPWPGFKSSDPKIDPPAIFKKWNKERYHMVGDDIEQPGLLFKEATKYGRFLFLCGELIAGNPERPVWNKGDFFGDHYGKK